MLFLNFTSTICLAFHTTITTRTSKTEDVFDIKSFICIKYQQILMHLTELWKPKYLRDKKPLFNQIKIRKTKMKLKVFMYKFCNQDSFSRSAKNVFDIQVLLFVKPVRLSSCIRPQGEGPYTGY